MGSKRLAVACATALVCALAAASASAQLENLPPLPKEATDALGTATEPAPYLKDQTGQDVDTDYTPIAKESKLWTLHQGARYDASGPEVEADYEARFAGSLNSAGEQVTTWDDELTDVAFSNTRNGFAGGQRKIDCDSDGEPDTYVPVIYRYGESPGGLRWVKPTEETGGLLGGCSSPGFVGQIAWIRTTGMALAVGGDGSYPYRAPAYGKDINGGDCAPDPTKPFGANCDQAGLGRAWLYNHGRWQELDYDEQGFRNRPLSPDNIWGDTLHGMTALEFSPLPGKDFGFAGALGQIRPFLVAVKGQNGACEAADANDCVKFPNEGRIPGLFDCGACTEPANGKFDMDEREGPDGLTGPEGHPDLENDPPPASGTPTGWAIRQEDKLRSGDTDNAFRFRFRVRQVRMDNGNTASSELTVGAVAVTDGCCAGGPEIAAEGNGAQLGSAGNYPSLLLFDKVEGGVAFVQADVGGKGWRWQLWSADHYGQAYEHYAAYGLPTEQRRELPPPNPRADWPDSFYSVGFRYKMDSSSNSGISLVASPGGLPANAQVPERPSLVSEPICASGDFFAGSSGTPGLNDPVDWTQPGPLFSVLRTQIASVRLVDGDGDELVAFASPTNSTGGVAGLTLGSPPFAGTPSNAQRNTGSQTCAQGSESRTRNADGSAPRGDTVPDWAVGELRSTHRPGLGARGLAFSTVSRPTLVPEVVSVGWDDGPINSGSNTNPQLSIDPARVLATLADPVNNPPTTKEKLLAYLQSQHFFTGSYALNAIDYLDGTGIGWAVGMHGGIVGPSKDSLASKQRVEPEPPPLGAKRSGQAPERAPYEAFDPPATEPGAVPPLGARPREPLGEHVARFTGAPNASRDYGDRINELGQLIMSRDGAEGWGLDRRNEATGSRAMTLFHLQGGAWSRCDPEGIDGAIAADHACAELGPLRSYVQGDKTKGVTVAAAARIPYENDADASNDDEFEVLAIGTGYPCQPACMSGATEQVRPSLMRYREGAWQVENDRAVREFLRTNLSFNTATGSYGLVTPSLAFASPTDGWIVSGSRSTSGLNDTLLHFNGERWTDCTTAIGNPQGSGAPDRAERCDDSRGLTISAADPPGGQFGCGPTGAQDCDRFTGLTSAGGRLYLYGYREVGGQSPERHPLVLCKDAGEDWRSAGCGLDPGLALRQGDPGEDLTGQVNALAIIVGGDGVPRGWAAGVFGGEAGTPAPTELAGVTPSPRAENGLLRLGAEGWQPFSDEGPLREIRSISSVGLSAGTTRLVALPDGGGLIGAGSALLRFESGVGRWRYLPADLAPDTTSAAFFGGNRDSVATAVPDNRGGAWLALLSSPQSPADLLHYTSSPPQPVFEEAPTPLPRMEESFTALAGEPNGSLWASTSDGALYRYARTTGWDRVPIPGWRAERATVAPAAYALAVNGSGIGVVIGREGRIADIAGSEVRLNPAAGTLCDLAKIVPPCGTSRHLRAAAVAPDGAAMVGGEQLALLWRQAGGHFHAIEKPEAATSTEVTGLSLPAAGVAYLTTNQGQLFRGDYDGTRWRWRLESTDAGGNLLTLDPTGARAPAELRAVAVDAAGHGYAVGDRGVLLERVGGDDCGGDGKAPCWRLLRSGVSDGLTAVVLRGEHALVGGEEGLVLTAQGSSFALARPPDQNGDLTGNVIGLALAGGVVPGQVEAWAATDGPGGPRDGRSGGHQAVITDIGQLFHYSSDETEPLLNPELARSDPLADSPTSRNGEMGFAALGKLDCHREHALCPGIGKVGADYAALSRRSADEIAERAKQPNGPALSVFTGDLTDDAGLAATGTVKSANPPKVVEDLLGPSNLIGAAKLRNARAWLAEPLARGGLPFFSAVGAQDLSSSQICQGAGNPGLNAPNSCLPTQEIARAGVNDVWRQAFAGEPAPWGRGKRFSADRYEVRPLSSSGSQLYLPEPELDAAGTPVESKLLAGGARTHYAFDLVERETGKRLVRFAFADNSLKSLQASDPFQHPLELEANEGGSGQAAWLKRVLCTKGSGSRCSREPNQPAIVVANAPTYSNAVEDPRFLAKDAAVFESVLLQNGATAVISGSIGWNGRYWATAPGLHEPCPGEGYQSSAPRPGTSSCRGRSTSELPLGAGGVAPVARQLGSALGPADPVLNETSDEVNAVAGSGLLPFVVASGAGGKLAGQEAGQGFFHGYTIVRVPGDADPAGVLVEQRPLYEFLSITAASHVLRPGQKMTLRGVGRGPLVFDSSLTQVGGASHEASFDAIDSAAITHRYDLVEADPGRPWLPKRADDSGAGPYVPLDPSVATIDSETGVIAVGKGNNPRTFALGMLSVGCSGTQAGVDGACDPDDPGVHVATFPLLFESRRTFKPAVVAQPRVSQIQARAQAVLPQPPNPPQPPAVKGVELPSPPGVPVPPPVQVPNIQPPAPPVPPPPPIQQHPVPLDLSASAPTLQIAPQTTVIPPPAPPIQPAPPGGARREARQRQSATQSSGSGSGSERMSDAAGDLTGGGDAPPPGTSAFTRHNPARADGGSVTLLYGGGITLLALVAALGFSHNRPGRRSPYEPAPSWSRVHRR